MTPASPEYLWFNSTGSICSDPVSDGPQRRTLITGIGKVYIHGIEYLEYIHDEHNETLHFLVLSLQHFTETIAIICCY